MISPLCNVELTPPVKRSTPLMSVDTSVCICLNLSDFTAQCYKYSFAVCCELPLDCRILEKELDDM